MPLSSGDSVHALEIEFQTPSSLQLSKETATFTAEACKSGCLEPGKVALCQPTIHNLQTLRFNLPHVAANPFGHAHCFRHDRSGTQRLPLQRCCSGKVFLRAVQRAACVIQRSHHLAVRSRQRASSKPSDSTWGLGHTLSLASQRVRPSSPADLQLHPKNEPPPSVRVSVFRPQGNGACSPVLKGGSLCG